jgi:hypothetical protein
VVLVKRGVHELREEMVSTELQTGRGIVVVVMGGSGGGLKVEGS